MRIVFAGTPEFVLPTLTAIQQSQHSLVAVYTATDKPSGRGLKVHASKVKNFALQHQIALQQVDTFDDAATDALATYQPDLFIVMAYGLMLPRRALETPSVACVNSHLSLLPRWRGAAPVARAIEAGDRQSGICLIRMTEKLDAGPIIAQSALNLAHDETSQTLFDKLTVLSAQVVSDFLKDPQALCDAQTPQTGDACYAHKLSKAQAWLDWQQPAEVLERKVRALNPWPVAQTQFEGRRLRIWQASCCDALGKPGHIIASQRDGLVVACGEGGLLVQRLQLEGGKPMSASDFANGRAALGKHFHTPH